MVESNYAINTYISVFQFSKYFLVSMTPLTLTVIKSIHWSVYLSSVDTFYKFVKYIQPKFIRYISPFFSFKVACTKEQKANVVTLKSAWV